MMEKKRIIKALKEPRYILIYILQEWFAKLLSDTMYVKLIYKLRIGKWPNLEKPQTFNEKMSWLKLYGRDPLYTTMADKYSVKKYVTEIIGEQYVVENYGVYERWDDIDFDKLPNQFVLKGTHDSGGSFVCRDKSTFDFDGTKKALEHNLTVNGYYRSREWPYKGIKPRIIIDRMLDDHTGNELRDYKFWCFNGKPVYMYCTVKAKNIYENFYDMEFNPVMIDHGFPRHQPEFEKPAEFEKMKMLAEKLAGNIPFVRVDFFDVDGHIFFGEFTFFDWGGTMPFGGDWDLKLGELLEIPIMN